MLCISCLLVWLFLYWGCLVDERLRRLIGRMLARINGLMEGLQGGTLTPAEWERQFSEALATGHVEAVTAGGVHPRVAAPTLTRQLATQLHFLAGFRAVVQSNAEYQAGWNARAAMYAESVGAPYWTGKTKMLPLPAMPKDGSTICLTNCGCAWRIVKLKGNENYDCFWDRAKDDSCSTCLARERLWAPLKIRDGRVLT